MKRNCTFLLFIISTLVGCNGLSKSEKKRIRQHNLTILPIERKEDAVFFSFPVIKSKQRQPYPWEYNSIGLHPRITKEFFRCHGNILNPPIQVYKFKELIYHVDCGGIEKHSLPMKNKEEFVYPILIDLLNHIQEKTEKKVTITCGHRCPAHNLYADPSKKSQTSKHLIAAEVDFYVEGLEYYPLKIVKIIEDFFSEPFLRSQKYSKSSTPSWYNKEVALTLFNSLEGRDFDNNHPYPYLSIQVLYDKEKKCPVHFNWNQAYNTYLRN